MKRVVLITGGSRGIGFGIAMQLAQNGFDLAVNGTRSSDVVEVDLKKLKDLGADVIYCQGNISSSADRTNMLREVRDHFGRLNVLVNNAGIAPRERKDILEAEE